MTGITMLTAAAAVFTRGVRRLTAWIGVPLVAAPTRVPHRHAITATAARPYSDIDWQAIESRRGPIGWDQRIDTELWLLATYSAGLVTEADRVIRCSAWRGNQIAAAHAEGTSVSEYLTSQHGGEEHDGDAGTP